MGKQTSEAKRRKQAEAEPQTSPKQVKTKKGTAKGLLGWPWWLWVTGFIGLVVCFSRIFFSEQQPQLPLKGNKKKGGKRGKDGPRGPPDTTRYLELAMRLQEMTTLASIVDSSGSLDGDLTKELDEELTSIETEIQGVDDSVARDLRAMVSVVRGTLFQRGSNLTDEQVETMQNSYTYANPRYWDDYYNKTGEGERFDWYGSWDTRIRVAGVQEESTMGGLLRPYLAADSQVLMLGCGNSNMSEQMYLAGFEHIVNVDISENLLQNLRSRLGSAMPNMRWVYANASSLEFEDGLFDVIVDKGTLDAIEQNRPLLLAAIAESHRTLRPGGILLSITFNDRALRVVGQLDQGASWVDCKTHPFERAVEKSQEKSAFFLHACRRPST